MTSRCVATLYLYVTERDGHGSLVLFPISKCRMCPKEVFTPVISIFLRSDLFHHSMSLNFSHKLKATYRKTLIIHQNNYI